MFLKIRAFFVLPVCSIAMSEQEKVKVKVKVKVITTIPATISVASH